EDGIRDRNVTGVQTCALPISGPVGQGCGDGGAAAGDGAAGVTSQGELALPGLLGGDLVDQDVAGRKVVGGGAGFGGMGADDFPVGQLPEEGLAQGSGHVGGRAEGLASLGGVPAATGGHGFENVVPAGAAQVGKAWGGGPGSEPGHPVFAGAPAGEEPAIAVVGAET